MKLIVTAALLALSLGVVHASDFVGAYALVDKVTFEPSADHPERVKISGVFALANPNDRTSYLAPQRGYLYFSLPKEQQEATLREWWDLKASEGTHKVISFGTRTQFQGLKVRKSDEKASAPDLYQTGVGLSRLRSDTDYAPVKSLLEYR